MALKCCKDSKTVFLKWNRTYGSWFMGFMYLQFVKCTATVYSKLLPASLSWKQTPLPPPDPGLWPTLICKDHSRVNIASGESPTLGAVINSKYETVYLGFQVVIRHINGLFQICVCTYFTYTILKIVFLH